MIPDREFRKWAVEQGYACEMMEWEWQNQRWLNPSIEFQYSHIADGHTVTVFHKLGMTEAERRYRERSL